MGYACAKAEIENMAAVATNSFFMVCLLVNGCSLARPTLCCHVEST